MLQVVLVRHRLGAGLTWGKTLSEILLFMVLNNFVNFYFTRLVLTFNLGSLTSILWPRPSQLSSLTPANSTCLCLGPTHFDPLACPNKFKLRHELTWLNVAW